MKALSMRPPYWWLTLHAERDIDNREWDTQARGWIWLQAPDWFQMPVVMGDLRIAYHRLLAHDPLRRLTLYPTQVSVLQKAAGCIVGAARIADCIGADDPGAQASPWFDGPYGLVLRDAVALPRPVPCPSGLRLYEPPAEPQRQALAGLLDIGVRLEPEAMA